MITWRKSEPAVLIAHDSCFSDAYRTDFKIVTLLNGQVALTVSIPGPDPFNDVFMFKTVAAAKSFVTRHFGR